jgi:hypothetical protein
MSISRLRFGGLNIDEYDRGRGHREYLEDNPRWHQDCKEASAVDEDEGSSLPLVNYAVALGVAVADPGIYRTLWLKQRFSIFAIA